MNELEELSALDPSRDWEPDPARRARSAAFVDELTRSPAQTGFATQTGFAARWRLVVSVAAVACAAVVGVLAVPSLLPGDLDAAYASWTPVPDRLTSTEALPEAQQCASGWSTGWIRQPTAGDVLLAERRGIATTLLIAKDDDGLVVCDILDPADGVAGASLLDPESPVPPADQVSVISQGAGGNGTWYSQVVGRAGPGVTDVDVILPGGTTIRATTRAGWWLAWWPGREGNGKADELRFVVHGSAGPMTYRESELPPD
ncbi:hypothetical protein [Actinoplanes derwentensis]|uniref:Uncharacterized protein n=1 Tax=Actinoplanes derwentensis TaxID=113562 RepID=A0A1H1UC11_9ACTN|nr:hypothetical protein [Actinoplanes derwentensis]GID85248.1 hypothetical protein Ade03nite_41720 [Actinoplanes derwentensis]SDS69479.1 hypothetical protein SAMN04489716_1382 [Actinoplanes derwentensis]